MNEAERKYNTYPYRDFFRVIERFLPEDEAKELQRDIEALFGGNSLSVPTSARFSRYSMVCDLFKRFLPAHKVKELHSEIVKAAGGHKVYVPITEENKHTFSDFTRAFKLFLPEDKARELQLEIAGLFGGCVILIPTSTKLAKSAREARAIGETFNRRYLRLYELFKHFLPADKTVKLHQEVVRCSGGRKVYVPVRHILLIPERNERIRKEFTGNNMRELTRKHNLSYSKIYVIVRNK